MTKTSLFAAALLAGSILSTAALASDLSPSAGPYLAAHVGYGTVEDDGGDTDDAAVYGGALGYRLNPNFRVEAELSYRNNDYASTAAPGVTATGDFSTLTGMVNAWYDFANSSNWTPYVGAGAGFAHGNVDISEPVTAFNADDSDTVFAWQVGAGLAYALAPNMDLTMDYRYLDTADYSMSYTSVAGPGTIEGDYSAHEVRAGVRLNF